jgi:uridine kinase
MEKTIKVIVNGKEDRIESGTSLLELAKNYEGEFNGRIVLAMVGTKLQELATTIEDECEIQFIDTTTKDGFRTYKRSLSFVLVKAIMDVVGVKKSSKTMINYAINNGFYCEISKRITIDDALIGKIKTRMDELIGQDLTIQKTTVRVKEAIDIFEKQNMKDKVELLKYRKASNINLYILDGMYNYFYGYMVPSTGYLSNFELYGYDDGIVLQFMEKNNSNIIPEFNPDKMLFKTLKRSSEWAKIMGIDTVSAFNNKVSKSNVNDLILVSEALMEKRIGKIADKIINNSKKFIFIAGPSSSGKTTFAHRLSIQLMAHGVKTYIISLDNYYHNRERVPKDENGEYDLECLEALDVDSFNQDMVNLLQGNKVDIPSYNFLNGKREYKGNYLELKKGDIVLCEGIHGLNDKMSYSIDESDKFKIYISALTQLNIDRHNRIPTTDVRLLRRIVRDYQYRGSSATDTIGMWESVRRGEEKHIFPFQEEADVMFNSALIYELFVLKQYAEPLLYSVDENSIEHVEAKRLLKFLDYFLGISSEKIPNNSLIREFIGNSSFR